jgi:hypothetical protein
LPESTNILDPTEKSDVKILKDIFLTIRKIYTIVDLFYENGFFRAILDRRQSLRCEKTLYSKISYKHYTVRYLKNIIQ